MEDQESLVSISEASRILGVSEPALRQWTDEGKIKAFITPGGHRRYSRAELKRLMSAQGKTVGIKDLVVQLEDTVPVHREMDRSFLESSAWFRQLSEESQKHLASQGRNILNLIIRYISEPAKREDTVKLAREAGRDFGETLAGLGLPLTEAVEIFIRHRDPVMNAVTQMMKKREGLTGKMAGAMPLAAHIMDEALVALVAAHQQYKQTTQEKVEGRTDDINYTPAL